MDFFLLFFEKYFDFINEFSVNDLPFSFERRKSSCSSIFSLTNSGDSSIKPNNFSNQLVKFLCENPVRIFGIKNKGFIKEGFDADFTIVDMNKIIEIKNENIESKCGWSPFNGHKFKGTPMATIINGKIKMKDGKIIGEPDGSP